MGRIALYCPPGVLSACCVSGGLGVPGACRPVGAPADSGANRGGRCLKHPHPSRRCDARRHPKPPKCGHTIGSTTPAQRAGTWPRARDAPGIGPRVKTRRRVCAPGGVRAGPARPSLDQQCLGKRESKANLGCASRQRPAKPGGGGAARSAASPLPATGGAAAKQAIWPTPAGEAGGGEAAGKPSFPAVC